jgi:hypothetical protein
MVMPQDHEQQLVENIVGRRALLAHEHSISQANMEENEDE